jgi:hypothetical protein
MYFSGKMYRLGPGLNWVAAPPSETRRFVFVVAEGQIGSEAKFAGHTTAPIMPPTNFSHLYHFIRRFRTAAT